MALALNVGRRDPWTPAMPKLLNNLLFRPQHPLRRVSIVCRQPFLKAGARTTSQLANKKLEKNRQVITIIQIKFSYNARIEHST